MIEFPAADWIRCVESKTAFDAVVVACLGNPHLCAIPLKNFLEQLADKMLEICPVHHCKIYRRVHPAQHFSSVNEPSVLSVAEETVLGLTDASSCKRSGGQRP